MLDLLFFVFFITCFGFGFAVVTRKEPVYSVLCLIMVFVAASCHLLLLGADFVAMALVMLYLGAIVVLFLFVVMMMPGRVVIPAISLHYVIGCITAVALLGYGMGEVIIRGVPSIALGKASYPSLRYDARAIGDVVFADFIYEFFMLSLVLLVAVVGAVVLTYQGVKSDKKSQSVADQLRKRGIVVLKKIGFREGVDLQ